MKGMTQEQIAREERIHCGSSPTNNKDFDRDGYLLVRNLWNPDDLFCDPPKAKGSYSYTGKTLENFNFTPHESQVEGSTSRYYYPPYRYFHSQIRLKIEKIIGKKLYNTYYYDRFYNPGQRLDPHSDRPACEISVTFHVSSNVSEPWPIWIKTPDTYDDPKRKMKIIERGDCRSIILHAGDGLIYKGCERPHWRDPLPLEYENKRKFLFFKKKVEKEDLYYHQIFFHYVLADGLRAEFAGDNI